MNIFDLENTEGRSYPARRVTKNLVGGVSSIQCTNFSMGYVELEPSGGQVPWHNHPQEEVYFVIEGRGEMCIEGERTEIKTGQIVHIPSNAFHQFSNIGTEPLKMIYCYGPAGDVDHWKQELAGTLPVAGIDVPALPEGAYPQCTSKPKTN